MARPVWKRRDTEGIHGAFDLIPAVKASSRKDFRPPPTIESDFERYLAHDVPHVNFTFELVHDWFAMTEENYEPMYIRAQQTPIDWKSKIGNSDMSTNFKVTHKVPVCKGDMVIREDGMVYLLNWNVQNHPNNQATQSIECNCVVEITRDVDEEVDDNGYLIREAGRKTIVPAIPCSHAEYAGRPDFSASQGQAGIAPDHLITLSVQWNSTTKDVRIGDQFQIGNFTYRVINISVAEVHISRDHGVLILHAKRVAGGAVDDTGV